ncbi:MAG: ABC transporter permease [Polyangiales bacterium]
MKVADLSELVRMSLAVLTRSPARSALTVLGLAIGVGAFIAMTSFGEGAKRAVVTQFEELGANVVRVRSMSLEPPAGLKPNRPILDADLVALRRDMTSARRVIPMVRRRLAASTRRERYFTIVQGTPPDYFDLHHWPMSAGGRFDEADTAQRAKVCILGATPARELFGDGDPLGEKVTLGESLTCRVIGVLTEKGLSTSGRDYDDVVMIPLSTYGAYIGMPNGYSDVELEPTSARLLPVVKAEAAEILRSAHALGEDDPDDFKLSSPTETVKAAEQVSTILTRLLAAIAAVSLLVGGIGIMNIQLVAVAERTREIGIRAAIGASPKQILRQFLAEAIVLSSVGALVGTVAGIGMAVLVAHQMHWNRALSPLGILGAAAFGIGAGVVFGYIPAKRAASLDPIEALRHE